MPRTISVTPQEKACMIAAVEKVLVEEYRGDVGRMLANVTGTPIKEAFGAIRERLEVVSNPRKLYAKMGGTYGVLTAFLRARGLSEKYHGFKPYHLKRPPNFSAEEIDFLIRKKCEFLMKAHGWDLGDLIWKIDHRAILKPLREPIGGATFEVKYRAVVQRTRHSPIRVVHRYFESIGRGDLARLLRHYHPAVSADSFEDFPRTEEEMDELILKKVGDLVRRVYGGDVFRLIQETTQREMFSGFWDQIGEFRVWVQIGILVHTYKGRYPDIIRRYLIVTGQGELEAELRYYHFGAVGHHTDDGGDEILTKFISWKLAQAGGDWERMERGLRKSECAEGRFPDYVCGRVFWVKTHGAFRLSGATMGAFLARVRTLRPVILAHYREREAESQRVSDLAE